MKVNLLLITICIWVISVLDVNAQISDREVDRRVRQYIGFESGAVRPIAKSVNGQEVYITNIPNHSLDIFSYSEDGSLTKRLSVPVGIEPVAASVSPAGDVWVVNHLSDSISIVDVRASTPHVKRTLLVGDEPRDIVFAKGKAFITTAHRGQHRVHASLKGVLGAGDPKLFTSGIPRADVWVFDSNNLGVELGGRPVKIVELFGDTPRALVVSPDENQVYVAVFNSGNQTSVAHEAVVCYGFDDDESPTECQVMDGITSPSGLANGMLPAGRPGPGVNKDGVAQPWTSVIVKYDRASGEWRDAKGRNFSNAIRFHLPDKDVFSIDTTTLIETSFYQHVGTTLFNMAINPVSGLLYVTNTDANNNTRFEGPGYFGSSTVQGSIAFSQITVINPSTKAVMPRLLNRHIDYYVLKASAETRSHSVATPTQIEVSSDGQTAYITALGSNKVAVYKTSDLEDNSLWDYQGVEFDPTKASSMHFNVEGGPTGLLLNEARNQVLVYTRFDNSLVVLNSGSGVETQRISLKNPEPEWVKRGRFALYNASKLSSNGEASCASCHIFGDTDHLSWNLGNPDASNTYNYQPFPTIEFSNLECYLLGPDSPGCQFRQIINGDGGLRTIASMKGPMMTQTLRGMSTHGHMHWRGDRSNGYFGDDTVQTLSEHTSFKNFIVAYEGLLGMDIDLPESVNAPNKSSEVIQLEEEVSRLADFILNMQMPPNPIRNLNNRLSVSARSGQKFFSGKRRADGVVEDFDENGTAPDGVNCAGCHTLNPRRGFFGTDGQVAHGGEVQVFKVPQLRNLYTRVGMFGLPDREGFLPSDTRSHQGDQIRGFGFLHDGATDLLFNFLKGGVFDNGEKPCPPGLTSAHGCETNDGRIGIPDDRIRQGLVDFAMEFPSDLAPIVGQQITISKDATGAFLARLRLLERRAARRFRSKILGRRATECELVAEGIIDGKSQTFVYRPRRRFYRSLVSGQRSMRSRALKRRARGEANAITFTCKVPGSISLLRGK